MVADSPDEVLLLFFHLVLKDFLFASFIFVED